MPLYQFSCESKKCEKSTKVMEFIVPLSMWDDDVKCPKCKKPLKKLMSAPYFAIR